MIKLNTTGYSATSYEMAGCNQTVAHYLEGQGVEEVPKFDDNRRPIQGTVSKKRVEVYYEGMGTMKVSLPVDYTMPKIKDLAEVELIKPEAFINRSNQIYVRAEGVKAV